MTGCAVACARRDGRPARNVGGVELEIEESPGTEPALVFLHEASDRWRCGGTSRSGSPRSRAAAPWSTRAPATGNSYVPDAPRTPRFMHDEALDVLPALLRRAGIERPSSSATATAARSR